MTDTTVKNGRNNRWAKEFISIATILFLIGISWGTTSTDIANIKEEQKKKANKELIQIQLEHINEKLKSIESKVDKLNNE